MKMNKDQLLVIASDASVHIISKGLSDFFGIKMIRANSAADAIELMVTDRFAMILLEDDFPGINPLGIAERLSNHGNSGVTPLVFITNSSTPLNLFESFPRVLVNFLSKPVNPGLLKEKFKIFLELSRSKNSVAQSIRELDHVYKKVINFQRAYLKEQDKKNEMANFSSTISDQMQIPLKNIQAGIYQLQKTHDLTTNQGLNHIRNAAEQIARITKRMSSLVNLSPKRLTSLTDDTGEERPCNILYVAGAKDEFDIFRHYIKGTVNCVLHQARTITRAKKIISAQGLDIIFINHLLSDGPGLDLLSDLTRRESDIPIIFVMNSSHETLGPKALEKGAHNFLIKEKISSRNLLSIIWETLEKSSLEKEIQGARERLVLISRRDHLTRLYNRQYFDRTLNREMDKAGRYQLPLSILMVDFDRFKRLNQAHGYETGDQILTTSAGLIKGLFRNQDVACRYGGDEFAIILPNTGLNGARILAQRILKKINSHGFDIDKNTFRLTVSIGISSHVNTSAPSPYQNQDKDLVKQALKAVGVAVQQGGNTIQYLMEAKSDQPHD